MFITPHTAAAIWIAENSHNIYQAFGLAFLSHFILDIIPHGDENIVNDDMTIWQRRLSLLKFGLADMLVATFLLYYYIGAKIEISRDILAAAVSGAWLPDLLWLGIETFKLKFLNFYVVIHSRIHDLLGVHLSWRSGWLIQIAVLTIFLTLIFS